MTHCVGKVGREYACLLLTIAGIAQSGCAGVERTPRDQEHLLQRRVVGQAQEFAGAREAFIACIQRIKLEQEAHAAGRLPTPPVIDVLIISGGGDWGAFGSGFLKGWGRVADSDPMAQTEFDIVTGVSTGALIAPFAFVGDDESIERVVQLYRNPGKDWVKERWPLYFLPNNLSFAEVPGLERELRESVTPEFVARLAESGKDGRVLAVNTTNLDDASARSFLLVEEAQRATESGDLSRLHNIMLASSGIPGAFPYREIDGNMYVDGGVTSNIMYGGRLGEEDSLPAVWQKLYPDAPIPKLRFWIIFNNQLQSLPTVVPARWLPIVTRSIELSTRSATLTAMRHLHAMAEISRLKHHADVEVRIVAVPGDWTAPVPGVFIKESMNALADLGEKMGADPSSWSERPPLP